MPICDSRPASTARCTWSGCASVTRPHAQLAGHLAELAEQVAPLAHPQVVEVLGLAHRRNWLPDSCTLPLAQVVPERDDRQQVGAGDVEPAVQLVGRLGCSWGRSRGSWIDSADAITSTSRTQF
jgi:hypothetical protein